MSTNMKLNGGLWSASCAFKVARNLAGVAVATAAIALAFENIWDVIELLRVAFGGGGFWHSWALCATPAVVAAYGSCLSNNRTLPRLFRRNVGRWSRRLSIYVLYGITSTMIFWRTTLWRSYDCYGYGWMGQSMEQCKTDWSTWKICASFALVVFALWVAVSSEEHPVKETTP
jgi:hypothetical protein